MNDLKIDFKSYIHSIFKASIDYIYSCYTNDIHMKVHIRQRPTKESKTDNFTLLTLYWPELILISSLVSVTSQAKFRNTNLVFYLDIQTFTQ